MKRIRRFGAFFALAATLALSGCALLPEEEVLPEAPVQRTGAQEAFTLDYVQRGDLVRTERYTATYRAVRQEQLCFAVSGVPFDEMYVSEGETVRSGQLLAQLDTGTFEEEAASQAAQIETLALEVRRQEENRALAQEKWEIEWSYMDEEAREDAAPLSEVLRPYDRAIEDLQGQIEVARVRQAQTEAYVRERQLRAGISGVVTYARSLEKGTLSDETEVVFTISDAGSSLFVLSTKDLENFPEGRTVETVVLLSQQKPDDIVRVGLDLDELDITSAESKATYQEIKAYVWKQFGLKVSTLYISQVKRKCGLDVGQNYNRSKREDAKVLRCPLEKEEAIRTALRHFQMI